MGGGGDLTGERRGGGLRRGLGRAGAALLALGLCALAALGLALALSRGFARDSLRARLEAALAQQLGGRVSLAGLEGPLYPELTLRGVALEAADGSALRAERVRIACAPLCGWRAGRLELAALELEGARVTLAPPRPAGSPAGAPLPFAIRVAELRLARTELELPFADLRSGQPAADGARARLALDGSLEGAELAPEGLRLPARGALELALHGARFGERAIGELRGRAELAGAQLRLADLDVETDAGQLRGAALELDLSGAGPTHQLAALASALHVRGQLGALDLAAWSGLPALRSALDGGAELAVAVPEGRWSAAELELHASLRGAAAGAPLDALELALDASGGRWRLERAHLAGASVALDASGAGDAAGVEQLSLSGRAEDLDALRPPALAPWLGGGRAEFSAQGAGRWSELSGTAQLRAAALRLGDGPPGELRAELEGRAGELQIRELVYRSAAPGGPPEQLRVSGRARAGGELELRASLEGARLARLPAALRGGRPLEGRVSGELELRGPAAHPQLHAALRASAVRAAPLPQSALELELRTEGERADGHFALDLPGAAELRGEFALPYPAGPPWPAPAALFAGPDAHLELRGRGLALADLLAWSGGDPRGASGTLGLELRAQGAPGGPQLRGELELAGARADAAGALGSFGPADGTLRFEQRGPWHPAGPPLAIALELAVAHGAERWPLRLSAQVHHWLDWPRLEIQLDASAVQGPQRVSVSGLLQGLRAAPLRVALAQLDVAPWLPAGALPLGGRVDAQFELRGALLEGPELSGALLVDAPRVGGARGDRLALEFATEGERFRAQGHLEALGTLAARLSLDVPGRPGTRSLASLAADPSARAELRSERLDLRWLEPLLPPWMRGAEGLLDADLSVRGAPGEPVLAGSLELKEASARIALLGQRVGPLSASAHLENRALVLDRLRVAAADGGELRARGELALAALRPTALELRAELERFPASRSAFARFGLSGELALRGPLDALAFSGALTVHGGQFAAPDAQDPLWKEIRVLQASGAAPATELREQAQASPWYDGMRGRLTIAIPEDSWVRGRGAELEVSGNVEIRKQPGEPLRYYGGLETTRGGYQLGRRTLAVERGTLLLGGSDQLDPLLDVLAATEVREHRIEVALRGPLSDPQSELRSDPPLPRDDVLALLLFGVPTAELEQDRAAALGSVLALLGTELGGGDLRTQLARVLPFDTLSVGQDDAGTGTRLEVGRYVRQGLFVSYGRNIASPQAEDAVQLEWRLTPSLSLKSETSSAGHAGADLIWRKDY